MFSLLLRLFGWFKISYTKFNLVRIIRHCIVCLFRPLSHLYAYVIMRPWLGNLSVRYLCSLSLLEPTSILLNSIAFLGFYLKRKYSIKVPGSKLASCPSCFLLKAPPYHPSPVLGIRGPKVYLLQRVAWVLAIHCLQALGIPDTRLVLQGE